MFNDKFGYVIYYGVMIEFDFMEEILKYLYYCVDCVFWKIVIEILNKFFIF